MTQYYSDIINNYFLESNKILTGEKTAENSLRRYLINTSGCRIPYINPFDKTVLKYYKYVPPHMCSDRKPLIESNQTSIRIVKSELKNYDVKNIKELLCGYVEFSVNNKIQQQQVKKSYDYENRKRFHSFEDSVNIYSEFIQVLCFYEMKKIYEDFHTFIIPKKAKFEIDPIKKTKRDNDDDNSEKLSVIILGVDSLSRLNYLRQMPKTNEFIRSHKPFEFFGYNKPTDYHLDKYMRINEKLIGNHLIGVSYYCLGNRFVTDFLLDYANKFILNMTYSNKKYWSFFWATALTHDYLNVPSNNDMSFLKIFKSLVNNNVLNNSMVILMSDHGLRWGSIRETFSGRLEEHMPLLLIFLPDWFKKKYKTAVKYMRENAYKLTTHFDLHETMKDLLNLNNFKEENLNDRILKTRKDRGISLFLPIPENRTCETAGIGVSWCTCNQIKKISIGNRNVKKAVQVSVKYINSLLKNYNRCAKLKLSKILSASLSSTNEDLVIKSKNKISDFIVSFLTEPGYGKFESTVRHLTDINKMSVVGHVARINSYGDESKCIFNENLKLYCFCI
ncbi:conserved hypothetical protein [Pediculus humanus corporis]|uniref:DUF229 domain containing protein n=1 Tax=Pediculus humanus subsp. corporis TaxID=121224 RepID=E0VF40_PEDHC|nr:uncharacterized protein Phum_PHUM145640 [Pediculus humanus corporis]EEB11929.1 conserved hypothetical protein [Pediculus humanus corporis]